jgi:hypothetical protein
VLGASSTLGRVYPGVKQLEREIVRKFRQSFSGSPGPCGGGFGRDHFGPHRQPFDPTAATNSEKKCTEPVAPSSGFPTDLRRSGCRSESHQPRTLRTRCNQHPRRCLGARQGPRRRTLRNLRFFLYATVELRSAALVRRSVERRKRAGQQPDPQKFAEPGTLSSTFPTNIPLPRSAPRGASSYRRPVLGAGRRLRHVRPVLQGHVRRNFSLFASGGEIVSRVGRMRAGETAC